MSTHELLDVNNGAEALESPQTPADEATESPHRRTSLLQQPDVPPAKHSHRIPGSQYFALMVWVVLLLLDYGWTRIVCLVGIPQDCSDARDIASVMHDFEFLLFSGVVLAILTGIHWPDRFQYIFHFQGKCPRGAVFLFTLFASSLVWGTLSLVPGLKGFSITPGMNGLGIFLVILVIIGAVVLSAWHIKIAWQYNSRNGFVAYVLSRMCIVVFYVAHAFVLPGHEDVSFHFHHYVIGYIAASLAEFNHPLSLLLLAIGTGVYIQGISAYDADPVIVTQKFRISFTAADGERVQSPLMSREAADWVVSHAHFRNQFVMI